MSFHPEYRPIHFTRIATFDVYAVAKTKNHVAALIELDVTLARQKLREIKRQGRKVSFNAWVLWLIGNTVSDHPEAAAYRQGKRRLVVFPQTNISMIVEKEINQKKVPIPLVISDAGGKSIDLICQEIDEAKTTKLGKDAIVMKRNSSNLEKLYYHLPGFLRRLIWRIMLSRPTFAYKTMGNVSVTSLGMMGSINGWFIHRSVHPLSFGLGSIIKKPRVDGNNIEIREIMNVTLLLDHDALDGAPMARFVKDIVARVQRADGL